MRSSEFITETDVGTHKKQSRKTSARELVIEENKSKETYRAGLRAGEPVLSAEWHENMKKNVTAFIAELVSKGKMSFDELPLVTQEKVQKLLAEPKYQRLMKEKGILGWIKSKILRTNKCSSRSDNSQLL